MLRIMLILIKITIRKKFSTLQQRQRENKSHANLYYSRTSLLNQSIGCRHVKLELKTCIWLSKDYEIS